jgi:L-alanine-DL-glutamate epimerase-like enolase superfamily enzyme
LAANIPNILMVETIGTGMKGFAKDLIKGTIRWEDGFILAPTGAGLGIAFDEELARANPYNGNGLHLEMQDAPCDYKHGNAFQGGSQD